MPRVRFGKLTNIVALIGVSEFNRLQPYVGNDVDVNRARKYVDALNGQLKDRGMKGRLVLQKCVPWDLKADYRVTVRAK